MGLLNAENYLIYLKNLITFSLKLNLYDVSVFFVKASADPTS